MDKRVCLDATSTEDAPTPGYILNDVSKATFASYKACMEIQDFLLGRLSKPNHNVKYKALVMIKHICRTGRVEFKRELIRKADPIRECIGFKGPADPLRGDEIYRRVREAAKETLAAIFDDVMPSNPMATSTRIQGIGGGEAPEEKNPSNSGGSTIQNMVNAFRDLTSSDSKYTGHAGSGSQQVFSSDARTNFDSSGLGIANGSAGGSYNPNHFSGSSSASQHSSAGAVGSSATGIGNPNFPDSRNEPKSFLRRMSDSVATTASNVASRVSVIAASAGAVDTNNKDHGPPLNLSGANGYTGASNRGPNAFSPSSATNTGGWGTSTSTSATATSGSGSGVPLPAPAAAAVGQAGRAASDGNYEFSLVSRLCEPGGMRTILDEEKLESFLKVAGTLTPDLVGAVRWKIPLFTFHFSLLTLLWYLYPLYPAYPASPHSMLNLFTLSHSTHPGCH
jgi:hypothetical protein